MSLTADQKIELQQLYDITNVQKWSNSRGERCKISYVFKYNDFIRGPESNVVTEWRGCKWVSLYESLNPKTH